MLTGLILLVRLAIDRQVAFCGGADACFYYELARAIATRHDFLVDFVWNYQVAHPLLPSDALAYWRPGTSLLLALGGGSLRGALLLSALGVTVGALAAAYFTWSLTRDAMTALLAYAIALCLPSVWTMALSPDSAPFYEAAVAWFLASFTARPRRFVADLGSLACLAAAYLIRNDTIILLLPFAAVLALRVIRACGRDASGLDRRGIILRVLAFALALLPTHLINYLIDGNFFNSAIMRVLIFTRLEDFNRYGDPVSIAEWIRQGVWPLLSLRLSVLARLLHHMLAFFGEPATLLALLAAGVGLTRKGWSDYGWALVGPLVFLISIVLWYTVMMPAIGDAALRSYSAFLPFLATLAAIGIRRLTASRQIAAALTAIVLGLCLIDGVDAAHNLLASYADQRDMYRAEEQLITAALPHEGERAVVMVDLTGDTAPFTAITGIASVPLPSNGLAATRAAIREFGVTHIVMDKWRGGLQLGRALRASAVDDVPKTTQIVITLPRSGIPQSD